MRLDKSTESGSGMKDQLSHEIHALGRTAEEWAEIEAKEHDQHYQGAFPFGRTGFRFTVTRPWHMKTFVTSLADLDGGIEQKNFSI